MSQKNVEKISSIFGGKKILKDGESHLEDKEKIRKLSKQYQVNIKRVADERRAQARQDRLEQIRRENQLINRRIIAVSDTEKSGEEETFAPPVVRRNIRKKTTSKSSNNLNKSQ